MMVNRERLVRTFTDLVRIDSPSGEEEAVAAEAGRRLAALGLRVERDAYGNVIATDPGQPQFILSAHMDTVEPGRGVNPVVDGDIIRSDGSTILGADCKAGIAAILEGLAAAHDSGRKRAPVQVVLTRQEEIGLVGARNLDFSKLKAREAYIFDGGGAVNNLTTGSPTYIRFQVKVIGRAAHAGVEPEKGVPAIRIAAEIITSLPQGRLDAETTFNVGTIQGGTVRNAVPAECTFVGEFRSRNKQTLERVQRQLVETLEQARRRNPEAKIEDRMEVEFEGYSVSVEDPLVVKAGAVLATLGLEARPGSSGGGTDANVFTRSGIKAVVVGMASQGMHTVGEHVRIPDLVNAARFCEALVTAR